MLRYFFRRLRKNEDGASALEFAVVALILITMIFGIIEFGWILNGYITLTTAVREGARMAIVSDVKDEAKIKDLVIGYASTFQLAPSDVHIDWADANKNETTVRVEQGELPLLVGFLGKSVRLTAAADMWQEQ